MVIKSLFKNKLGFHQNFWRTTRSFENLIWKGAALLVQTKKVGKIKINFDLFFDFESNGLFFSPS